MSSPINRLTLSEEFQDTTSSKILRAPEPQYLHAVLWKMALGRGLDRLPGGLGLMAGRMAGGVGAPYPEAQEFQLQLSDPIMTDALLVVPSSEAKVGHTVRINRPRFTDTTYTEASREITRTTVSTTPTNIGSEQVALTIKQYAGPYDTSQTKVAPYGLDSFDASRAVHDLAEEVGTHLQRDFDKTIDYVVGSLYDAVDAGNIVYPSTAMSSDNDIATAGSGPLSFNQIIRGVETLENAKAPKFANGQYALVIGPTEKRQLAEDDEFQRLAVFIGKGTDGPSNPLLKANFYASVSGADIYVSQTLRTAANTSSINVRRNQMFGPGAVGSMVVPVNGLGGVGPRVQASTDDNFGLTAKVIWVLEAAFKTLDSRFAASLRTG